MLFMVIETFTPPAGAGLAAVRERFAARGRMLPDGVVYLASWMTRDGARCFQVMEAPSRAALDAWVDKWRDIVGFEVIEAETSAAFWAREQA